MPSAPYSRRAPGVVGIVRIGPDPQAATAVGPGEQLDQPGIHDIGHDGIDLSAVYFSGGSVERDPVAFLDYLTSPIDHEALAQIDLQLGDADHGRLAELAGDQRGMTGATSPAGQNAFGGQHAVNIVRLGFGPHHDDFFVRVLGPRFGQIRIQGHHSPTAAPGDTLRPAGQQCPAGFGGGFGLVFKLGVQKEVDLFRSDAQDGFFPGDQPLFGHVNGNADSRTGRCAYRLRVCSIHSRPSSTVNSTSCISR
jgi:hypothetical protein